MNLVNLLNNTILIPYHDSLVDGHQLPKYDIAGRIGELKDLHTDNDNNFAAYIRVHDKSSVRMIAIQQLTGFAMTRENEQRPSMNGEYVINLPGPVTYNNIKVRHIFTRDKFFLDWLTNGVSKGGSARAEIEIVLSTVPNKDLIFTLYDAFPVAWRITNLDSGYKEEAVMEEIEVAYSSVSFKSVMKPGH